MKKIFVIIIFVVIISIGVSVYAEYSEPLPQQPSEFPYIFIGKELSSVGNIYVLYYSNIPVRVENYRPWTGGRYVWDLIHPPGLVFYKYIQIEGSSEWLYQGRWTYEEDQYGGVFDYVIYSNSSVGTALIDLEVEEYNNSFFGIDFDYSGFFGDLKVQLGKKEESGTYKIIKEWQYPKGSGHVSIPASQIPQGNKGEYMITIYEGDTIINQYPYIMNVEESPYCNINYPVNGQEYNYYPNVNIQYYNMGRLYIYINGEMYKQIQTDNRKGIEVINGRIGLFDIGSNTVAVMDSNGQVVATVQYMVMREGLDPNGEISDFEAESWVKELFNRIMNEYSLFFEYVKSMYAFLPVEIVGLVGIIMMLSVILWFTGRK